MSSNAIAGRIRKEDPPPRAPAGLSSGANRKWREAVREFRFDPAELALLEAACWAWHRAEQARAKVEEEGMFTYAESGMAHPHPAVRIERDALREFRLCWSKLGMIDPEGAGDRG